MALWRCLNCGSKFAVGLRRCPQCTSTRCVEDSEELDMPKTTATGATNAADPNGGASSFGDHASAEGGDSWDGNDSSTSSPSDETNNEQSKLEDQSPAPTTENPSSTGQTDASTAPSTDGDPSTEVTGELAEQAPYDEWTKQALTDEIERRNEVRAELGADLLKVSGTKAELAERLLDDDTDPNRPEAPAIEQAE